MRRLRALALAAGLLLSACAPQLDPGSLELEPRVDVDTPQLRELKQRAGVEPCEPGPGEAVDGGLPELTLPCLGGGEPVDLSTLRGPMVVNLWAVWCGPCRRELPVYQEFHERYGDRVAVLGIDFQDTQPRKALELVEETGVTYPLLADPGASLSTEDPLPAVPGLPGILFVDEDGLVVDEDGDPRLVFEEVETLEELEGLVSEHLGVRL